LTASQDLTVTCANFLLDEADDFIDERSTKRGVLNAIQHNNL
jgi:hypothetical protein